MNLNRFCAIALCLMQASVFAQQYTAGLSCSTGVSADGNYFGAGVSFADIDLDGWPDLTISDYTGIVTFLNNEGTCEFEEFSIDLDFDVKQPTWVDFDNDGDRDLFVTQFQGPDRLFENDGSFNFTDITESAGFSDYPGPSFGCAWSDYDNDGDLDVYVCKYHFILEEDQEEFVEQYENRLFRNNSDGTFTDVTAAAGVSDGISLSFQGAWFDYDRDSWPDLFVINDLADPNRLYHNNGDGTFTEVGESAGVELALMDAMSASPGDFNNDGYDDLFISNVAIQENALMLNNGDGTFTNVAESAGTTLSQYTWGASWADIDLDGWLDLYIAEYYYDAPGLPNIILMNNGDETFENTSSEMLVIDQSNGYSVARADWNHNGTPDFLVSNLSPQNAQLWSGSAFPSRWLQVRPEGVISNKDGVGVAIEVWSGEHYQYRYTRMGEAYMAQNSSWEVIGLGSQLQADSIQLTWPSGIVDVFYDVPHGSFATLVEGSAIAYDVSASPPALCPGQTSVLSVSTEASNYYWEEGIASETLEVDAPGWYTITLESPTGYLLTDSIWVEEAIPIAPEFNITAAPCSDGTGSAELLNPDDFTSINWLGADPMELSAGNNPILLIDTQGCTDAIGVMIPAPDPIQASPSVTGPLCNGDANAMLAWNVSGGTPPYTYSEGEEVIEDIPAGTYNASILDSLGCPAAFEALVPDPPVLTATVDFTCTATGISLIATSTGGTPPTTFEWQDGTQSPDFSGELGETYTVTATDFNGCQAQAEASCPVGIDELNQVIRLVPNPATQVFRLEGITRATPVVIKDVSGRQVARFVYVPHDEIDVQNWPAGMYLVYFPQASPQRLVVSK